MTDSTTSIDNPSNSIRTRLANALRENTNRASKALALITIVAVLVVPFIANQYYVRVAFLMVMWIGLASSWNILGGLVGYPSFGHVAFLGLGAFTVGLVGKTFGLGSSLPELIGLLLLAGLVAVAIAAIVAYPLLRLRGGYFAIATLGIAVVIREIFANVDALGAGIGIAAPTLEPPLLDALTVQYYLMALIALLTVVAVHKIKQSKMGYAFAAIREGEDAAKMLGVPTVRYKIIAFLASAFFPGVIGGLYVYFLAYFTAGSVYSIQYTVDMIVYTVIGGLGTITGPIIGAPMMVFLSRIVLEDVLRAHVFLTGLFIVVVMMFFPRGIVGIIHDVLRRNTETNGGDTE